MCPSNEDPGRVSLRGASAATEVSLIDSSFTLCAEALERLSAAVPAGIYKARFQLGNAIDEVPFELRPGEEKEILGPRQVAVSPAPLGTTQLPRTRPFYPQVFAPDHLGPGEGELRVLLRTGDGEGGGDPVRIEARSVGSPIRWQEGTGARVGTARLPAGMHVLAMTGGGERFCRPIPIGGGQVTVLSLYVPTPAGEERLPPAGDRVLAALLESSLLVTQANGEGGAGEDDLLLQEMAQQALARSHALLRAEDLARRPVSPMAMLLGAHGLIEARRAQMPHPLDPLKLTSAELEAVSTAYHRLRDTALGASADVAALGLASGQSTEPVNLDAPPLLVSTWLVLVATSLSRSEAVLGGAEALRIAEGLVPSPLWLIWRERAPSTRARPGLRAAAAEHLEPALRPSPGRLPSWVKAPKLDELVEARADALARGLLLPVPLVLRLTQNMREERASTQHARVQRRIDALSDPRSKVCLVVLPDGVRVSPSRGQPIDCDAIMDVVDEAAARAGLVAVHAPPLGPNAEEVREALARADVLVVDVTFSDPEVMATLGAWLARDSGARRLIRIRAEGFPAPEAHSPFTYSATFGTGISFARPGAVDRALVAAAKVAPRDRSLHRGRWLRKLARAERLRLEIRQGRFPSSAGLGREAILVQLDLFLAYRVAKDWKGMLRTARVMTPALRRTALVREQLALALRWSEKPANLTRAVRLLKSVIEELGPNGETCGLLGGLWKSRWWDAKEPEQLEEAIRWYREGLRASPLDPYPGVNLLTLLAAKGTEDALAEHARLLPQVELAASRSLYHRPTYWELASMLELAANKRNQRACDWYHRLALAASHDLWQRETTVKNLKILRESRAAPFQALAGWLDDIISALCRN